MFINKLNLAIYCQRTDIESFGFTRASNGIDIILFGIVFGYRYY